MHGFAGLDACDGCQALLSTFQMQPGGAEDSRIIASDGELAHEHPEQEDIPAGGMRRMHLVQENSSF